MRSMNHSSFPGRIFCGMIQLIYIAMTHVWIAQQRTFSFNSPKKLIIVHSNYTLCNSYICVEPILMLDFPHLQL